MAKTQKVTSKAAKVIWQEGEEGCPGEPALLLESYSDSISITQETESVQINVQSIPELIRQLKAVYSGTF